jgi:hypothetical protein
MSKSAIIILYEQCRCLQEIHTQTITYYNRRLTLLFRVFIVASIIFTFALFIASAILHIDTVSNISYIVPALFAGLMTFYRVKQNEYGLVERSAIIASLQSIVMEVDLATEVNSTRLEILLAEYRRIISNYTHFPPEIEKTLVAKWAAENLAIPEFLQTRISSSHMTEHQLFQVDQDTIQLVSDDSPV